MAKKKKKVVMNVRGSGDLPLDISSTTCLIYKLEKSWDLAEPLSLSAKWINNMSPHLVYITVQCENNYVSCACLCAHSLSHVWLCDFMDCSPPGSSVRGIFQARILEQAAISFSRGFSWPRDQSHLFCIGRQIPYHWTTWKAPIM